MYGQTNIKHIKLSAAPIPNNEHFVQRNLKTPRSRALLKKLRVPQLAKKFPAFHGTRRFITAFTRACHLSLLWATSVQPKHTAPPYFLEIHFNSILPPTSVFQMVSIPQVSPPKPVRPSPLPIPAMCPTHFILLGFTTLIIFGEGYSRWNSLCSLLYSPVKKLSIFLSTHPQISAYAPPSVLKTKLHTLIKQNIKLILYVLIFTFLGSKLTCCRETWISFLVSYLQCWFINKTARELLQAHDRVSFCTRLVSLQWKSKNSFFPLISDSSNTLIEKDYCIQEVTRPI